MFCMFLVIFVVASQTSPGSGLMSWMNLGFSCVFFSHFSAAPSQHQFNGNMNNQEI